MDRLRNDRLGRIGRLLSALNDGVRLRGYHTVFLPYVLTSGPRNDETFLDEIAYRSFLYFWREANPQTGLIKDRAKNFGKDDYMVASTAAVGFGLTALCIGKECGWITSEQAYDRAITTLLFFRDDIENVHGFYYHFVDLNTGERVWNSEVSSIDTALFLAGALVIASCFPDSHHSRNGLGKR